MDNKPLSELVQVAQLAEQIKQPYQVVRNSETNHKINSSVSMKIETFARINPRDVTDDKCVITFFVAGDTDAPTSITTGAVF